MYSGIRGNKGQNSAAWGGGEVTSKWKRHRRGKIIKSRVKVICSELKVHG